MSDSTGFLAPYLGGYVPWFYRESIIWTFLGLAGQGLFSARFLVQWLSSERHHRIVVPPIFWHLSFWGSVLSLIYALHVDKIPFILGFALLPFLYARNLVLLGREWTSLKNRAQRPHRLEIRSRNELVCSSSS